MERGYIMKLILFNESIQSVAALPSATMHDNYDLYVAYERFLHH